MTRPHPRLRTLSAGRRERFIQQLNDLLEGRREILLALRHGSFLEGGSFRDVDLAPRSRQAGFQTTRLGMRARLIASLVSNP